MNECLQTRNQCGMECRRRSISLQQRWVRVPHTARRYWKERVQNLDLTSMRKLVSRDSNENPASSSQVRQSGVNLSCSAGKPVAKTTKIPVGTGLSHHNMTISLNNVGHLEKGHSNVRRKLGRQPDDDMLEIDVNMMTWGSFMSASIKAAVHLEQDYQETSLTTRNMDFDKIKQLFDISQKLIKNENQEIYGISTIDLHDRGVELWTAKVYVFSDSVLCLGGRIAGYPRSVTSWKDKIEWFTQSPEHRELDGVDGESVVCELKKIPTTHNTAVTTGNPKNDALK